MLNIHSCAEAIFKQLKRTFVCWDIVLTKIFFQDWLVWVNWCFQRIHISVFFHHLKNLKYVKLLQKTLRIPILSEWVSEKQSSLNIWKMSLETQLTHMPVLHALHSYSNTTIRAITLMSELSQIILTKDYAALECFLFLAQCLEPNLILSRSSVQQQRLSIFL